MPARFLERAPAERDRRDCTAMMTSLRQCLRLRETILAGIRLLHGWIRRSTQIQVTDSGKEIRALIPHEPAHCHWRAPDRGGYERGRHAGRRAAAAKWLSHSAGAGT